MLLIESAVLYKILLTVLLGLYWVLEATWLAWLFGPLLLLSVGNGIMVTGILVVNHG